jgi:hypothetical protein
MKPDKPKLQVRDPDGRTGSALESVLRYLQDTLRTPASKAEIVRALVAECQNNVDTLTRAAVNKGGAAPGAEAEAQHAEDAATAVLVARLRTLAEVITIARLPQ